MKKNSNNKLIAVVVIIFALAATYGGYKLYHFVVADITRRVKAGVSKGIVDAINPFKWPGKIFRRRRDTNE